ncbi:MAG: S46 family peptidase [Tannerella sp.]|jgi:hypothetical protein|nr:S46 family peptidase [Tannerella sp.]
MNRKKLAGMVLLLIAGFIKTYADEGMWIINELNAQSLARMKELGFTPDYKFLYDKENASLSNAVVIFGGGCTGITVSDEGLIFTNHHCGYGSLQALSSVEHDYLKNGFISQQGAEELPVEGLSVRYLKETVDVTDSIVPQISHITDEYERIVAADSIGNALATAYGKSRFTEAYVTPFYAMNKFYLIVYNVYRDVRLVFAPPSSLGKFGGDTDNWMWPRHTCDFSVFRVYADTDNQPADYSADNRPYKPLFYAEVSLKGYQNKDYAMTIGFPGSTDRYLSTWGVSQRIKSANEPRIEVRGVKQEIWKKAMQADDAVRIKYASKYAGSSNYWKNSIGMNRGLANLHVIDRKRENEAAFAEYAQKADNQQAYGEILKILQDSYEATDEPRKYITYLSEAFSGGTEIIRLARIFSQSYKKNLSTVDIEEIMRDRIRPFFKDYDPSLDRETLAAMMRIVKEKVPQQYLPDIYASIDKKYKGDYERYAADLYAQTALLSEAKMIEILKDGKKHEKFEKKDPAALLTSSVIANLMKLAGSINNIGYEVQKGKRLYIEALGKMFPDSVFYPDANSTMRLSYGSIGGYQPYDAAWYNFYTTDKGILQKEDSTSYEFWLQPEILDLVHRRDFGKYANEKGELQLCFLSNNDITGGNSGSPVFNKNGHLIGLAFDGNWEAMSGDIAFEPELQRSISVDIRYVLWMIEKWGRCQRIIDELKISK